MITLAKRGVEFAQIGVIHYMGMFERWSTSSQVVCGIHSKQYPICFTWGVEFAQFGVLQVYMMVFGLSDGPSLARGCEFHSIRCNTVCIVV